MSVDWQGRQKIDSWRQFRRRVRDAGSELLVELPKFPDSILVTGCQRSGTTALARLFTATDGLVDYRFGKDDELDAALILSGYVRHECSGRYCFQTTYMYDRHEQYLEYGVDSRLIWLVRNPRSVVWSMLFNWKRSALNELFDGCGRKQVSDAFSVRMNRFGAWSIPRLYKACFSYAAKVRELEFLVSSFPSDRIQVVDYDNLVAAKDRILPMLFDWLDLPYRDEYAATISARSVAKSASLSRRMQATIDEQCQKEYSAAKKLITLSA